MQQQQQSSSSSSSPPVVAAAVSDISDAQFDNIVLEHAIFGLTDGAAGRYHAAASCGLDKNMDPFSSHDDGDSGDGDDAEPTSPEVAVAVAVAAIATSKSSADNASAIEMVSLANKSDTTATTTTSSNTGRVLTLTRVCLQASPGDLIALVGKVGAGKSSVLGTLLGDLKTCAGSVAIRGRSHTSASDPSYRIALIPDLKILPLADLTEIGERGINLSVCF